jgi:hypothetical protein
MHKKHLTLGNLPKSNAFAVKDLPAKVKVTHLADNHKVHCALKMQWHPSRRLQLVCQDSGEALKPFEKLGTKARIEGEITDGALAGWRFLAPVAHSRRSQFSWKRGSPIQRQVWFVQEPQTYVELIAPACEEEPAQDDVLCYWIPGFSFQGVLETSKLRKRKRLDGFRFSVDGNEFIFRQLPDHKEVADLFENSDILCAITTVMEARGPICRQSNPDGEAIGCLFSLISALWGFWVHPLACARYQSDKKLKRLTFFPRSGRPHHPHRSFINVFVRDQRLVSGWPEYLETTLPNFIRMQKDMKLRSICRQLVEAQYGVVVETRVSILLMCLEQICTRYLVGKGMNILTAPLQDKANHCNKDLRCLSKGFRKQLPTFRNNLRNALFHEGATYESDTMKLYGISLEMLNASILLLSAVCGYRGDLQLQDLNRGERVISVDANGKS